jgi:predicted kinase
VPTVHLLAGPVGAGKTTRARELGHETRGVVFSLDEWLVALFGPDAVGTVQPAWLQPRLLRCEERIWSVARRLLELGIDVVLDLGFMRRDHRDRTRALARSLGADVRLHEITADLELRRTRVRLRNQQPGAIPVSDALFDWMETQVQPVADDER